MLANSKSTLTPIGVPMATGKVEDIFEKNFMTSKKFMTFEKKFMTFDVNS